ncbi:hypothetical protein BUZ11_01935 [Staphylococcus gallinarum]|uniref:Uncharacterized protein n=1 Tax=Staphylococcus gallinarum TaxID=1293 RepID=A0A2T4SWZ2_STAGA|nr:hypothetical protein BUY96_00070 [Staphylococcus gallinarum]PTK93193.1 hypothetical protein BUZ03_00085 [Staphylococcus gallinarum]PTL09682.1 hypothetical protein BUZ15_07735 [Staphylococcus gallinarum]PTL12649.1 hypothetical protein BUZ09_00070 [Staphylococcus gallinarum]RIL35536.1 hypothetical protein BUY98_00545 [Staphylococcus gallinarum]
MVLLARFPRGQLQPVVFRLSCSLRSLAKILCKSNDNCIKIPKNKAPRSFSLVNERGALCIKVIP